MVVSVAAHGVALVVLGNLRETDLAQAATKIEVFEAEAPEAPPPPPPPPPKPKAEAPKPTPRAQSAEPAPPLATDPGASALDAAPDFGLSLSGGVAVAPAANVARTPTGTKPAARQGPVRASANLKPVAQPECTEPAVKPKVLSLPRPAYSEQARAAGVEGKVRIQLTVDSSGNVTQVRVLAGLGYGLDEAAVQAAKQARFEPGVRCGKPESSTFTIAMRFTAG